jgi:CsoR family transcriptional regulator, copper-sensing transcriptional repressor
MMNQTEKSKVAARLSRIEGQVRGIRKMVDDERYCVDILTQTRAVVAALRGVEDLVMETHLDTCVADAMKSSDPAAQQEKIDEVMSVMTRFRRYG